jgi:hypothetical protein
MATRLRDALVVLERRLQSAPANRAPSPGEWRMFRLIGRGLVEDQLRRLGPD